LCSRRVFYYTVGGKNQKFAFLVGIFPFFVEKVKIFWLRPFRTPKNRGSLSQKAGNTALRMYAALPSACCVTYGAPYPALFVAFAAPPLPWYPVRAGRTGAAVCGRRAPRASGRPEYIRAKSSVLPYIFVLYIIFFASENENLLKIGIYCLSYNGALYKMISD